MQGVLCPWGLGLEFLIRQTRTTQTPMYAQLELAGTVLGLERPIQLDSETDLCNPRTSDKTVLYSITFSKRCGFITRVPSMLPVVFTIFFTMMALYTMPTRGI